MASASGARDWPTATGCLPAMRRLLHACAYAPLENMFCIFSMHVSIPSTVARGRVLRHVFVVENKVWLLSLMIDSEFLVCVQDSWDVRDELSEIIRGPLTSDRGSKSSKVLESSRTSISVYLYLALKLPLYGVLS